MSWKSIVGAMVIAYATIAVTTRVAMLKSLAGL